MTGYQASQAMRRLETAVRECNAKIKRYKDKYAEISDITGIAQDKKRMTLTKSADKIKGTSTPKTPTAPKTTVKKPQKSVKNVDISVEGDIIKETKDFVYTETNTTKALKIQNIEYNAIKKQPKILTDDDIIKSIAGGDETKGSCASVALAYCGQKQGYDVHDFRGGNSMNFFSGKQNKVDMFAELGVKSIVVDSSYNNLSNGIEILKQLTNSSEYYLSVGRHAAIVRNNNGVLQFLELQSKNSNGWKEFGNVEDTLIHRFGCSSSSLYYSTAYATDIEQLTGDDFKTILGYINTETSKQKKGAMGNVK